MLLSSCIFILQLNDLCIPWKLWSRNQKERLDAVEASNISDDQRMYIKQNMPLAVRERCGAS